jgi:hypothetical protein
MPVKRVVATPEVESRHMMIDLAVATEKDLRRPEIFLPFPQSGSLEEMFRTGNENDPPCINP